MLLLLAIDLLHPQDPIIQEVGLIIPQVREEEEVLLEVEEINNYIFLIAHV